MFLHTLLACALLGASWVWSSLEPLTAQESPQYVGSDKCAQCHPDVTKSWALTGHRRTLFNADPARKGCEGCHGPGGTHADSGDPTKIVHPGKLKSQQTADICLKCHNQEHVTLWRTSLHARAKLSCTSCHDSHNVDPRTLSRDIENGKLQLEGLTRAIRQAELQRAGLQEGSAAKDEAETKVAELKAKRDQLQDTLKGQETAYRRVAEPYVCYNCHKTQQIQSKMASHHPIPEGKMNCSDCHNPHGGLYGMLKEDTESETCFRCHAEKEGPFVFNHPPVVENCAICHNPHGSAQNNLLLQGEPFLCLKCHAGPHSRSRSLASGRSFAEFYSQCTACHNQVHGSDEHAPLHY